jgi:hypothetical protein
MRFSPDTYVIATPGQISSEAGSEFVILNMDSGQYHGLQGVGARVWELVTEGSSVARIQGVVLEEYDVEEDQCRLDIERLLADLEERGLIELRDAPAG